MALTLLGGAGGAGATHYLEVTDPAYGAIGNGTADDTAAINAAISAANAQGGGVVVLPAGYTFGVKHVDHGSRTWAVTMKSNVTLHIDRGATLKLLASSTSADGANTAIICNENPDSVGDHDMFITGEGVIDGNAANTPSLITTGVMFGNARRVRIEGIGIKNCRGTAAGPPGETMGVGLYRCVDAVTDRVTVYSDDGGETATGIGYSQCTAGRVTNCTVAGLTYGMGIGFWDSADCTASDCHSYLNGGHGFLTEYAQDILFVNCIAGGLTSDQSQTAGKSNPLVPAGGAAITLGNGQDPAGGNYATAGFCIDTGTRITIRGGKSSYNGRNSSPFSCGVRTMGVSTDNVIDGLEIIGNGAGVKFENGDGTAAHLARVQNTYITRPELIGPNKRPDGSGTDQAFTFAVGACNYSTGQINGFLEPAIAASTTAVANPFPFDVTVKVIGGTVSAITVTPGGNSPSAAYNVGVTSGYVRVPHGGSITITYSVAPTWDWFIGTFGAATDNYADLTNKPSVDGRTAGVETELYHWRTAECASLPRLLTNSSTASMASGSVVAGLARNRTAQTYTQIRCYVANAGASLTGFKMGVWSADGLTVLAESEALQASLVAAQWLVGTLSPSLALTLDQEVMLGFSWTGTTAPQIRGNGVGTNFFPVSVAPIMYRGRASAAWAGGSNALPGSLTATSGLAIIPLVELVP